MFNYQLLKVCKTPLTVVRQRAGFRIVQKYFVHNRYKRGGLSRIKCRSFAKSTEERRKVRWAVLYSPRNIYFLRVVVKMKINQNFPLYFVKAGYAQVVIENSIHTIVKCKVKLMLIQPLFKPKYLFTSSSSLHISSREMQAASIYFQSKNPDITEHS